MLPGSGARVYTGRRDHGGVRLHLGLVHAPGAADTCAHRDIVGARRLRQPLPHARHATTAKTAASHGYRHPSPQLPRMEWCSGGRQHE